MNHVMELAPHSYCIVSAPGILWTLVVADFLTGIAYLVIPYTLEHLARRQTGAAHARLRLIQAFVVACGLNHFGMLTIMFIGGPAYYGLVATKVVMAALSVATAAVFWRSRRLALDAT